MRRRIVSIVRLFRPAQWLKNGFVLAPLVFAGRVADPSAWSLAVPAVVTFCLAASATYVLNDLIDRDRDVAHPTKRLRPLASGELSRTTGVLLLLVCLLGTVGGMMTLGEEFAKVVGAYLGVTLLYSLGLKRVVFLDVLVVAAGFVLRVVAGAVAVEVPISPWLVVCAYLLALYLALGKRRAELVELGVTAVEHREVLGHYSLGLVDQAISVVLGATVVSYTLYTVAPGTVDKVGSYGLLATVPVVMYGLFRYLYLLHARDSGGEPGQTLLRDVPLLLCVLMWLCVAAIVITLS